MYRSGRPATRSVRGWKKQDMFPALLDKNPAIAEASPKPRETDRRRLSRLSCLTARTDGRSHRAERVLSPPCYTFPMKRLIVNADDFGLTHGVNRAIAACHQRGIVSSATLMATGACFDEAVALAGTDAATERGLPRCAGGWRAAAAGRPRCARCWRREPIASITRLAKCCARWPWDASGPRKWRPKPGRSLRGCSAPACEVSHFDAHKHTHMFPSILRPLLRAASAHGIAAVRNPFEAPRRGELCARRCGNGTLLLRKAETTLLRAWLRRRWLQGGARSRLFHHRWQPGRGQHGHHGRGSLRAMLRQMPQGTWELVCHPGYNDSELAAVRTKLRESREVEMGALLGITERELRETYGAELVSFRRRMRATGRSCRHLTTGEPLATTTADTRTWQHTRRRNRCGSGSPVIPHTAAAEWWPPSLALSWPIADTRSTSSPTRSPSG